MIAIPMDQDFILRVRTGVGYLLFAKLSDVFRSHPVQLSAALKYVKDIANAVRFGIQGR